jgi:DNA replication protein DnaC
MTTTEIHARLVLHLKELRMPTIRACYEEVAEAARREAILYEHYLLEVVEREQDVRRATRVERLLRDSRLPLEKTFEAFDRRRLPRTIDQQVSALVDGSFLERRENVLAFGNPGSGKTHLVAAIGHELVRRGHRVLFTTCQLLVQELLSAKAALLLPQKLKRLAQYAAVIIDDIGYVQQSRDEMEVLFTLLAYRYERGSVMLTSNLPFSRWDQIFKDPMTTAAAIDRVVHHSVILELNVPSYRLETSKARAATLPQTEGEVEA